MRELILADPKAENFTEKRIAYRRYYTVRCSSVWF